MLIPVGPVHACLIREAALSVPPTLSQDPRLVGVRAWGYASRWINFLQRITIESEVNLRTPGQRILRD